MCRRKWTGGLLLASAVVVAVSAGKILEIRPSPFDFPRER